MKIIEAREALAKTLEDIASAAEQRGFLADTKCYIADHDLIQIAEDNLDKTALIAGEILLSSTDTEEKIVLECALSVTDEEVAPNEMLREVNILRESMKEICDKFDELGNINDTIKALAEKDEAPVVESPKYDNKKFYITAGVVAAVVILIVLLLR